MRKAFSMLTAIVVIVLMAGITSLVMSLSGKIVKETSAQYRKEQSVLLAKSYTEFAILAIQGHDMQANGCLNTITGIVNTTALDTTNANGANNGQGYLVTARMQYIGLPASIICADNTPSTSNDVSVLIDVNVRYRDLEDTNQFVNYNRRTLQKL